MDDVETLKHEKCQVEGCQRDYLADGCCSMHLQRLKKWGNPHTVMHRPLGRACRIPDCPDQARSRLDLCNKHQLRLTRLGNPRIRKKKNTALCWFEDCREVQSGDGFCNDHDEEARQWDGFGRSEPPIICSIDGCCAQATCETLCGEHYQASLMEKRAKQPGYYPHRLPWDRVFIANCLLANRVIQTSGCWCWPHYRNRQGYGLRSVDGEEYLVHRLSAWLWNGFNLFSPLLILHSCDNPPCFNPEHLFAGTDLDNVRDKVLKNRAGVKLDEHKVRRMRLMAGVCKVSKYRLGKLFGVTIGTVTGVLERTLWKHIA